MRRGAIVDGSTAYGQWLASRFERQAKALGMTVVTRDAGTDKTIDFRAILTKIKGQRPDVIVYGGMDATGGLFARQAAQRAIGAKLLAGDGVCTPEVADLAGPAAKSIVCSVAGMPLLDVVKM